IPGGLEVTVPLPLPALVTVRVNVLDETAVLLISTETLSELKLVTTRSGRPSPLRSPMATEVGFTPAPKLTGSRKVPSPLPSSNKTGLGAGKVKSTLATARSAYPSLLTSATATVTGLRPAVGKLCAAWKVPSPLPSSTETSLEE